MIPGHGPAMSGTEAPPPGEPWSVNQVEIARRLGISQGTVHRALAGKKDVSKATSAAVMRMAAELGYRRNASATALRGSRFGSIGLIARQPLDGIGRTLSRIITRCSEDLRERGCNLILSLPPDDLPEAQRPRLLTDLCVDGLIVAGPLCPAIEAAVEASGLPVAWIDNRESGGPGVFSIDERASARIATVHLLRLGREVAFLGRPGSDGHYSVRQRLAGYREAMAAAGRPPVEVACPRLDEAEAVRAHLAARAGTPCALLCYNHVLGHHVLVQAGELGRSVPGDVALACCDDDWIVALQGVTTMAYDEASISRLAVAALCEAGDAAAPQPLVRRLDGRRSSGV